METPTDLEKCHTVTRLTLTIELLLLNSTGLHYTTFSIVMHYTEVVHLLQLLWYASLSVTCACDRHYRWS